MNKELLALRAKFKGQTAKVVGTGYDNSPIPEGVYTMRVIDSKAKEVERKHQKILAHSIMLKIETGECKGRNCWPFAPDLGTVEGVIAAAQNIRAILGDGVVPGKTNTDGEFVLDMGRFIEEFEAIAHKLIGELVEAKVKNSKGERDDGTPWQSVYINRGLGADAKAVLARDEGSVKPVNKLPHDNLAVARRKKAVSK